MKQYNLGIIDLGRYGKVFMGYFKQAGNTGQANGLNRVTARLIIC